MATICLYLIPCSEAVVDSRTNQISIVNVLEQLNVQVAGSPPIGAQKLSGGIAHRRIVIGSLWLRDGTQPYQTKIRFQLHTPEGTVSNLADVPMDMQKQRSRVNLELPGLYLNSSGIYRIVASELTGQDWSQRAEFPIEVQIEFKG